MKFYWMPLLAVVVACVAIDRFLCVGLHRAGHRFLAWTNGVVTVVAALTLIVLTLLTRDAAAPNGLFVALQYALLLFIALLTSKVLGIAAYWLARALRRPRATGWGVWAAATVLVVMWSGAMVTPRHVRVREVTLEFERLPDAFDGYRIVHWSDAHLGTYNGRAAIVERWVDTINNLHPDLICFTGDLVSRKTEEAIPYRDLLSRLHAGDGVYSVLGNHDYDNYARWEDERAKRADRKALCDLQAAMGWRLLNDDHATIARGDSRIVLIGTENYGERPGEKRGDLAKAYSALHDSVFKIQLQHNPLAWRAVTLPGSNIDLMLAGHTHAWQFMLEAGDWRWSPAVWRYPEWGGAYCENGRYLHVNTGVGMVGPPMRIGATPEITLITLKKKRQ